MKSYRNFPPFISWSTFVAMTKSGGTSSDQELREEIHPPQKPGEISAGYHRFTVSHWKMRIQATKKYQKAVVICGNACQWISCG